MTKYFCHRVEILQRIRREELERRKVEDRRRVERGLRDSVWSARQDRDKEQVEAVLSCQEPCHVWRLSGCCAVL